MDLIGLAVVPENVRALAEAGIANKQDLRGQVQVAHPDLPGLTDIAYAMVRDRDPDGAVRTCSTLKPGRVDRSPSGTGSSASLACLLARGGIGVGDTRISQSTIGGTFTATAPGETMVGPYRAVLPRITGSGRIYRQVSLRLSPDGPSATGFMLSDTRGSQVGDL